MNSFNLIFKGFLETSHMVLWSTLFSLCLGVPLGIFLAVTSKDGIYPKPKLNHILEMIINTLRSFPFIILMILIFPLSRIIVGTTIGSTAAIIPLSISAAPFVGRIVQSALKEVDSGLIEAAESMGAKITTIIFKVMIPEAFPSLIHGLTLTVINLIGYSAMAGAIGGGGLGDIAIRYGYQRFKTDIMIYAVLAIIILVQTIQGSGNYFSNKIKFKRGY